MDAASNQRWILIGGLILFATLLTPLRFAFPIIVAILMLLWVGKMGYDLLQARKYAKTTEGSIEQKITQCEAQINYIKAETKSIQQNIFELQSQLQNASDISLQAEQESKRLIKEFRHELDLRNTKLLFYQTCAKKLKSLLQNHQFSKDVAQKQETLKQLRERNQDDIADLEELRFSLQMEKEYLDSIDTLSLRMLDSNSLQDARAVQKELETITRELRNI